MKRVKSLLLSWEALLVVLLLIGVVIGGVLSPYFLTGFNKRRGKSHPLAGDWDESAVPFLEG
jgi:hypothetical protein